MADAAGPGETAMLRKLLAICGHLSTLASQAADVAPLLQILAAGIGCAVTVVDPAFDALGSAGAAEPGEIVEQLRSDTHHSALRTVLAAAARNRRALAVPGSPPGQMVIIAPVLAGEDVTGYLLARCPHSAAGFSEDMRLLAIEHAAMVCGVVLGRDLVVAAAAGRARQELMEGLLLSRDSDDPELERWARHLGLDPAREHCVLAFDLPASHSGAKASARLEIVLSRHAPGTIVAGHADELAAIVPLPADGGAQPGDQETRLARACLAADGQHQQIGAVGIGNPYSKVAGIARSYAEARRALSAGRRMGQPGTICRFAELGIHRLLLQVPEVSDLRSFAHDVLGALTEEGQSTGIDYLATLAAYFGESGSPARAARRLHIHPNTVSYRLRRSEELTGLSFSLHRDRLTAEVAVEILRGLEGIA
jgi:GGDEF-like domain/PucR C-terminal helix-turn-helix domain